MNFQNNNVVSANKLKFYLSNHIRKCKSKFKKLALLMIKIKKHKKLALLMIKIKKQENY